MLRNWLLAPVIHRVRKLERLIMATQAELATKLRELKDQNDKATAEQMAALQKLQDALDTAGGTSPEVDEALAALGASIQRDDDLNPDAPAPAPAPAEPSA